MIASTHGEVEIAREDVTAGDDPPTSTPKKGCDRSQLAATELIIPGAKIYVRAGRYTLVVFFLCELEGQRHMSHNLIWLNMIISRKSRANQRN